MRLTLQRLPKIAQTDSTNGDLLCNGVPLWVSLERTSKIIPIGVYVVALTVSQRALEGKLWSPLADCRLPQLMEVPERTGIRIHAANYAHELEGCIATGESRSSVGSVWRSRVALDALITRLLTVPSHEGVSIEIMEIPVV